jgi:hypothetical protein
MLSKTELGLFRYEELLENLYRIEVAVDDLDYCLEMLMQESDELKATNQMFKQTIKYFKFRPLENFLDSSKGIFRSSKSFIGMKLEQLKTDSTTLMKSLTPKGFTIGKIWRNVDDIQLTQPSPEKTSEPTKKKETFISPRRFVMSKLKRLD